LAESCAEGGQAVNEASVMDAAPPHPSFAEALAVWARIGLLSFGGPAGQIALMHKTLVEEKRWISETRFLHALNYCMLLPGPEAQQLATYVGWLLHGTRGGVVAGTLFVLPGFFVILALSTAYALFQETAWLASVFFGLKAAVLVIVVEAVIRVGRRALRNSLMLVIAGLAFLALFLFDVPFPLVILGAGLAGYFGTRARPELFATGGGGKPVAPERPSVIDDHHVHPDPTLGRAARVAAAWGLLWIAPLLLIVPALGWSNTFVTIAGFFSQMAMVTFGGAYAVLAYVAQQAVEGFGWLRPDEMIDGLALAETTPGPLVLVLSFVGFMAAFRAPMGLDPLLAGILGATLTTWVTFVPCFLWIFLGAPYVEKLRSNRALSGALAAITAAVVGVILNLAIWFGLHVLFREVGTLRLGPVSLAWPEWGSIEPIALGLSVIAAVALFRFKLGILAVLGLCAALGLAAGAIG
jgi:chromate transporter